MTKSYCSAAYIKWIPFSKRKPDPWTRIMVTYRVSYCPWMSFVSGYYPDSFEAPDDPNYTTESWIEDTVYTATFYDDGIEAHVYVGDSDVPVKYYFIFDDSFGTRVGLKKEVINNVKGRMTYEVTAWAKLPEPYYKRTRNKCPIKDIPGFMDRLDNDDRSHFRKEDRE